MLGRSVVECRVVPAVRVLRTESMPVVVRFCAVDLECVSSAGAGVEASGWMLIAI